MTLSERIPYKVEINRIIDLLARQIYQSPLALLRENCQNAYDAILQRKYLKHKFEPEITINISTNQVVVTDNGIGMTRDELIRNYWTAGASGKATPEARAAGVVGTFGIGAMANFGIATAITVITESATESQRNRCYAAREKLSATEDCIDMIPETPTGNPGTTIIADIAPDTTVNVDAASKYIVGFLKYLDIPVVVNSEVVSHKQFGEDFPAPRGGWTSEQKGLRLGPKLRVDLNIVVSSIGEVWLSLGNIRYADSLLGGELVLSQNGHQIMAFRSRFALARAAVSSDYGFGGIANLTALEPTAGREALTSDSLQLLQTIVTEADRYASEAISATPLSNLNTGFMNWVAKHRRFELCSNLNIRVEPGNQPTPLKRIKDATQKQPMNYFQGSDQASIQQYATEDQPLIVLSTSQPRRKCELNYLNSYCKVRLIEDVPRVLEERDEDRWSMEESAFALRLMGILETDYFVSAAIKFGKISHRLPILVDLNSQPIRIVMDSDSHTISMMLQMYREDFSSLTGVVKDFVRNVVFPKISQIVPSSTRQGAEAFLRAMNRPRDVFEYEKSDLGNLSEIWQDHIEGKVSLQDAIRQSISFVRTTVQEVGLANTQKVVDVIPDVLRNQEIVEAAATPDLQPMPAITRLDVESNAKLLVIDAEDKPLNGYRCFVAIIDRVRNLRSDFFLQPHRTEIVWGGQKALYIFQHHSGQFGLYYDFQATDIFSEVSGGREFQTSTIVLKNQVYIPVPNELSAKFIPIADERKRFEIKCELLYPDVTENPEDV
jgi:molecular chaperone HtpG